MERELDRDLRSGFDFGGVGAVVGSGEEGGWGGEGGAGVGPEQQGGDGGDSGEMHDVSGVVRLLGILQRVCTRKVEVLLREDGGLSVTVCKMKNAARRRKGEGWLPHSTPPQLPSTFTSARHLHEDLTSPVEDAWLGTNSSSATRACNSTNRSPT